MAKAVVVSRPPVLPGPARALQDWVRNLWPFLLSLALVLAAWEIVGRTANLLVLPPMSEILSALWRFIVTGTLFEPLAISLTTLGLGMAISIILGVAIGAAMALIRPVEYALDVYVNAAMSAPMIAFVPIFILIFGLGYPTRIIAVIIFAIFPIIVNTFAALRNTDPSLVEMARSFGASRNQLFWQVRLPDSFRLMLAGIRLGTARGVKGLINGEVLIAVVGLGALVTTYGNAFSMDRLYAIIIFLIILALITVRLVDWIARSLVRH